MISPSMSSSPFSYSYAEVADSLSRQSIMSERSKSIKRRQQQQQQSANDYRLPLTQPAQPPSVAGRLKHPPILSRNEISSHARSYSSKTVPLHPNTSSTAYRGSSSKLVSYIWVLIERVCMDSPHFLNGSHFFPFFLFFPIDDSQPPHRYRHLSLHSIPTHSLQSCISPILRLSLHRPRQPTDLSLLGPP